MNDSNDYSIREFEKYTEKAKETRNYPQTHGISYTAMGLAGEAGESLEIVKKAIRNGQKYADTVKLDSEEREELKHELGDVLWYLAMLCDELDTSLEEIASMNYEKLEKRYS